MLTHFKQAVGSWVMAQQSTLRDIPVGRVYDVVIDPDKGKIRAYWIKTRGGLRILLPKDIIHWNEAELLIDKEDDLSEASQLPMLGAILKKEVPILSARVYGQWSGNDLGKVKNFSFETLSPTIINLHVAKGWGFWRTKRIIPRKRIVKITEEGITVSDRGIEPVNEDEEGVREPVRG